MNSRLKENFAKIFGYFGVE
jgi:hypothetical protein